MISSIITGAGGFIGSHLLDLLLAAGRRVFAIDREPVERWAGVRDGRNYTHIGNCRILDEIDLADAADGRSLLRELPDDVDEVFHLAAIARIQPSFKHPAESIANNVASTLSMAEYACATGARLVFAGSSTCDDDPLNNPYALSKSFGEQICALYRMLFETRAAVARFYNVYGPRQMESGPGAQVMGIFTRQYRSGEELTVTGDGRQRRDFTHVQDICRGLVALAQSDCAGPVALGTGTNYSVFEVARMFVDDDRIEFLDRPPGESEVTLASADETEKAIGWRATVRLPDYVRDLKQTIDSRAAVRAP